MKIIYLILGLFLTSNSFSQNKMCGSDVLHHLKYNTDSIYKKQIDSIEASYLNYSQNKTTLRISEEMITIPVVVHVIHKGEAVGVGSNISDNQIISAINAMNDNFRNLNGAGVNMNIEFCLAKRDPSGNATNGINRVNGLTVANYSNGIDWSGACSSTYADESTIKNLSIWPNDKYYNIWVVHSICNGWAGYAYYPTTSTLDGTVIIASVMNASQPTLTHELGHGFNLMHTFEGSSSTTCPTNNDCLAEGDKVCDTPPHKQADCSNANPCTTSGVWDNSRYNYMSYCFYFPYRFTQGQKDRVRSAALVSPRLSLINSLGCLPPLNNDVGVEEILYPTSTNYVSTCTLPNVITPKVKIKNYGVNTITSLRIGCKLNNNAIVTQTWNGSLSSGNSTIINLSNIAVSAGSNSLKVITSLPNGVADPNITNDSLVSNFTQSDSLKISYIIKNKNCDSLGSIITSVSGGRSPYSFIWSNGNTSQSIFNLNEGSYTMTVKDNPNPNALPKFPECSPNTTNYCCNIGIYNVSLNTINKNSSVGGYENFDSIKTILFDNVSYTLNVTTSNSYSEYVSAWIDYNSNGTFEVLEQIMNNNINTLPSKIHTQTFTVPLNSLKNTPLRMRIASDLNTIANSCNNVTFGQHEDYTIFVNGYPFCSKSMNFQIVDTIEKYSSISSKICSGQSYTVCGQTYNATGTYVKVCTSSTGCDSTVTLNLVVRPPLASVVNATICSGQSYTVCGQMYNATGTYVNVCTSSTGCDSTVTLNLVVRPPLASVVNATICSGQSYTVCGQTYNATGTYVKVCTSATGCDSTVTLNLVVRPPLASVLNQTICPSGSSSVCGQSYTTEGTYTRICTSSTGCDSTVTLILTLGNSINTNITKYICSGQSYAVCGQMYNATGTYVKVCTSSTGCDSTVTLNLVVRPPLASVVNATICSGQSYTVCGQMYNATGTYVKVCTSSTGCDSTVTLNLVVRPPLASVVNATICSGQSYTVCGQTYNATGTYVKVCTSSTGCDSTVTLNLVVRPPLASVVNATICSGQSYTVCGQMYNATGTYVKVCTSSTGCDSTVTLNLVVRPPLASVVNATICSGQSYTVCGQTYNATGTYVKVCTSSTGCDSTVTLNLVVRPPLASVVNATICSGQSYTVCGQTYNATGTYVKVCTSSTGCDSTVTLNLVVRPPLASVLNQTICPSGSSSVCGQSYTTEGTYTRICTSSTGCDSTVTLILTLGNSINTNITKYICSGQSYAVCGQMYNATGTYVKVCTSSTGCDSTVTLNLVVRPPLASVVNATICSGQSYTVCGQMYNATGTYVKVCTSSTGCDSTVTLNLVVRPPLASVVNATICSGQSYTVCGQMYNATGTYVKVCTSSTGCDSTVTLNLVVRPPLASVVNATICSGQSYTVCGQMYNATGTYVKVCTSSTGCDSTVTLNLVVRPPLASVVNATICSGQSYTVCGQTYNATGTYVKVCTSSTGCDSTVTLNLVVRPPLASVLNQTICPSGSSSVCGQSYTTEGTYTRICTSSTGCDSTVTLNLVVRPPLASVVNATICSGQSYTVCGQMYNATGTYVKVCTSSTGCDSTVTLNLVVRPPLASVVNATICSGQSYTVCGQTYNATGTYVKVCTSSTGCDSTVTLNLVVRPPLASVVNATICSGQSYTVCGQMYNATGTYVKVCTSSTGCDSTVTLNLVVRPPLASVVNATICSGQSYTVCGQMYNATGTYVKVCTSSTGCDSTVTLNLVVRPPLASVVNATICSGQSYTVCGQTYNATGTYVKVCTSSTGCDSTVTLNLVVRPPLASVVNATICSGQSYTVCGQMYNATGTYVKVCTSSTGCDSTVTLNLVVRPPLASVVNATICSGQSYTVCGQMYNATGTYVKVCTSATGCDSTVTLNLVVRPPLASVVNATICSGQSYTVCGQMYNATGTYVKVCTSSTGCDSTVTLNLVVRPPLASVVNATICSGQIYTVCGQTYNATGTYVKVCTSSTGCDSTVTLNLVVRPPLASVLNQTICPSGSSSVCGQSYTTEGTYTRICTSSTGCDSTVTLILTLGNSINTNITKYICSGQSYAVCGQMYNATGTYVKVCTSATGCDSTVTLVLSVINNEIIPNIISRNDTLFVENIISPQYYWYIDGIIADTTSTPFYYTLLRGNWSVKAAINDSCLSEMSNVISITTLKNNQINERILIYPNPNKGVFNLDIQSVNKIANRIKVCNFLGEVIFDKNVRDLNSDKIFSIELENPAQGIYILMLETDSNIIYSTFAIN